MDQLSSQDGDAVSFPLNTSYGGGTDGHGHDGHHHYNNNNGIIIPSSSPSSPPPPDATHQHPPPPPPPPNGSAMTTMSSTPSLENNNDDDIHRRQNNKKAIIKYRECLKNHAASMGGIATDGCGEFMPSGEEGTIEALTCSACNCHRNFHRKELEGGAMVFMGHPQNPLGYHRHHQLLLTSSSSMAPPAVNARPRQMIVPYGGAGSLLASDQSDHDDADEGGNNGGGMVMMRPAHHHLQMAKKRHRTKFSQEQKEKMLAFADKVGWKIQKQEEAVIQQFCQEVGVKRRVLKIWMHNNKHNLARKNVNLHQDDPQNP